jgi:hypothetical protein
LIKIADVNLTKKRETQIWNRTKNLHKKVSRKKWRARDALPAVVQPRFLDGLRSKLQQNQALNASKHGKLLT